jgi:transposase InsO family protein
VKTKCAVLGVSKSDYFAWRKREPSAQARNDQQLGERIVEIHDASRGTYGVPRIHAELREEGTKVGRKRVAKLMKANNIQGVSRRKGYKTTRKGRERHGIPDLVERDFTAMAPDQLWVADITYVPTWSGFVFLTVVQDVFCAPHPHEDRRLFHAFHSFEALSTGFQQQFSSPRTPPGSTPVSRWSLVMPLYSQALLLATGSTRSG